MFKSRLRRRIEKRVAELNQEIYSLESACRAVNTKVFSPSPDDSMVVLYDEIAIKKLLSFQLETIIKI